MHGRQSQFGTRLRKAVDESGLPLKVIVHRSGYSESYIGRLLNGSKNNPTIAAAFALADVTGVSRGWLVGVE